MNSTVHLTRLGATIALLSTFTAGLTAQVTVTVPCNLDNTLYQDLSGTTSNGKGPSIFVGQNAIGEIRRAVLSFDIAASIPAGATILASSLELRVMQSTDIAALPAEAHRVLQAWGEGNSIAVGGGGGGTLAATGDATWLHSNYNTVFWTNVGGDFAATSSFALSVPLSGSFATNTGTADVQYWLDNPASNFGWLLKATSETSVGTARRLNSRQATTGSKPTLTVTFLPAAGTSGVWGTGCASGAGTFDFAFSGAMIGGQTVQLSHTNGVPSGIGANFFTLALFQPGLPLAPNCNIWIFGDLIPGNVFLFDPAGAVNSPWPVPLGYPGLFFTSQSIGLDNSPLGFILSNAGYAVIQ